MKNSGVCVKCGSDRVVKVNSMEDLKIPLGLVGRMRPNGLICCDCGYIELWAPEFDLEKLYKEYQWNKVNVPGK